MTLETIAAGILAIGSYMWIPYDPQPLDVQQEYYASTEAVSASSLHYFNSRPLADKICRYTSRTVYAFYQEFNPTPLNFYVEVNVSKPIIHSITPLGQSHSYVESALQILGSKARSISLNTANANNLMLGYLRSMSTKYSGDDEANSGGSGSALLWRLLCGLDEPVEGFWDTVDYDFTHHGSLKNYFSRFVEEEGKGNSTYNSVSHGGVYSYQLCWGGEGGHYMPDPCGVSAIDLIHMFASIDGEIEYTYFDIPTPMQAYNMGGSNFQKDLAGWGGDLQSATHDQSFALNVASANSFEAYMNVSQNCDQHDILADIDAFNIAKICDCGEYLDTAFASYYSSLSDDASLRFSSFAEAMCEETTYEWDCPLAEKVRREAHALLACKWTPSGYVDVYNSGLAYHLINSDVTFANRMILADLFADYIIGEGDL